MLGAADAELLFDAVDAVAAEDPKAVLLGVERMAQSGREPSQFARDLLAHLRHLLVTQTTGEVPGSFVVTATDAARLEAQAAAVGSATLVRTIDELAAALTAVREGDDARMAVEIALLKAARPDLDPSTEGLLRRIERLEARLGDGAPPPPPAAPDPDPAPPEPEDRPEPESPPSPEPAAPEPTQDAPPAGGVVAGDARGAEDAEHPSTVGDAAAAGPAGRDALDLDGIQRIWPAVMDQLGKTAPALAAFFELARPVGFDAAGGVVEISFPPAATFNKRKAEAPEQRERVAEALAAVAGQPLRPTYVLAAGEAPAAEGEAPPPADGDDSVDEEELLRRLKSEFDAEEVS